MNRTMIRLASVLLLFLLLSPLVNAEEVVTFPSGELTLHGALYKPAGKGPIPAVIYNHGSAAGMLSANAFAALGPVFASHGWVFFGPYRRGHWMPTDTPKSTLQSFFAGKTLPDKINHPRSRASRCLVLNRTQGSVFGFEMTNEDSVAHASVA
jgi:hypothetical protein